MLEDRSLNLQPGDENFLILMKLNEVQFINSSMDCAFGVVSKKVFTVSRVM